MITRVQHAGIGGDGVNSVSKSFTSNITAGNFIVVQMSSYYGDSTVPPGSVAVSDTLSNTYTVRSHVEDSTTDAWASRSAYLWAANSPSGGANTVQVSGMSSAYVALSILEYSGVADSSAYDTANQFRYRDSDHGSATTTTFTTNNISTAQNDELLIGHVGTLVTTDIYSGDTGWTEVRTQANSFNNHAVYEQITTASGTYALTGTFSAAQAGYSACVAAFKAAPDDSVAITGTATASISETDVRNGGKTLIATVSGTTFVPASVSQLAYVGGQVGSFAGTNSTTTVTFSLTGGLASTPAANDLVIVAYSVGSSADRALTIQNTGATNYTLVGSELYQNGTTYDSNLRVAYRFMPGTPETQFVLSGTGAVQDAGAYTVHVFRGVDSGTPLDVAAVTAGNTGTRVVNPGAITPSTAGAWLFIAGAAAGGTGGNFTASYLTDFRATSSADNNDAMIGAGYYTGWTSGSYDPAAFGGGGTDDAADSWTAVTVALRPSFTTPFADARSAIVSGIDSAQSEGTGWDARRSTIIPVANVVRTSDTVCTITFAADASYDITAQETVTVTIPAAALTGGVALVGTPTFTIDAGASISGATLAATLLFAGTVSPGAVDITGTNIAGTQLFAGSLAYVVSGGTIADTVLFAGTVSPGEVSVTGTTIADGQVFAGTVGQDGVVISGASIDGTQLFSGSVVYVISGANIADSQLFAGTAAPGAVTVSGTSVAATQIFAGTVIPGAVTLAGEFISATQLYTGSAVLIVTGSNIAGTQTYSGEVSLAGFVNGAHIASTVLQGGTVVLALNLYPSAWTGMSGLYRVVARFRRF